MRRVLARTLAVIVVAAGLQALPGADTPAEAALQWYEGVAQYSTITNCWGIIQGTPYQEKGMAVYTGFEGDLNAASPSPQVNQDFRVKLDIWGLGNSCSGQYAWPEILLPAGLSLSANPNLSCTWNGTQGCELIAAPNHSGAFAIRSTVYEGGLWPIPSTGVPLEISFRVRAGSPLYGKSVTAYVKALDGNDNPWLVATQQIAVFDGLPPTPKIWYETPSTLIPGTNPQDGTTVDYVSLGHLTTNSAGKAYLDLGASAGNYNLGSTPPIPVLSGGSWVVFETWSSPTALTPGTKYHWRLRFKANNGLEVKGANQVFTTPTVLTASSIEPTATTIGPGGTATWKVTFPRPVTGVDASDFWLQPNGVKWRPLVVSGAGFTVNPAAGAATDYTVKTVTLDPTQARGSGTVVLSLNSVGTNIKDEAGNALVGGLTGGIVTLNGARPDIPTLKEPVAKAGGAKLSWDAPAKGVPPTKYIATVYQPDGSVARTCSTTGLTCSVSGLRSGKKYYADVYAKSAAGAGSRTEPKVIPPEPPTVTDLGTGGQLKVSWRVPGTTSRVTGYKVRWSANGVASERELEPDTREWTFSNLTNGTNYSVDVLPQTFDLDPKQPWSSISTKAPTGKPIAVATPTPTPKSGSILVSWTRLGLADAGGLAVSYTARAYTTQSGSKTAGKSCTVSKSSSANSCTIKGLAKGKIYWIAVTAQNLRGSGADSNRASGVPQ